MTMETARFEHVLLCLDVNFLETHKTKRLLPTTSSKLMTQVTQPPGGSALRVLETYNLPSIKAWARIIDRVGAALVCRDLDQAIDFLSAPCNRLTYRRIRIAASVRQFPKVKGTL